MLQKWRSATTPQMEETMLLRQQQMVRKQLAQQAAEADAEQGVDLIHQKA